MIGLPTVSLRDCLNLLRRNMARWTATQRLPAAACARNQNCKTASESENGSGHVLGIGFGKGIAQHVLLHLAHRIARQIIDEEHALRLLEAREVAFERA